MTRGAFYGLACPIGGEAHGPLLKPHRNGEPWICPHAEHRQRGKESRSTWTLEELQAAGVAP